MPDKSVIHPSATTLGQQKYNNNKKEWGNYIGDENTILSIKSLKQCISKCMKLASKENSINEILSMTVLEYSCGEA